MTNEKPTPLTGRFDHQRFGRLFSNAFREGANKSLQNSIAEFICTEWNATHATDEDVKSIRIIRRSELIPGPSAPLPLSPATPLGSFTCNP